MNFIGKNFLGMSIRSWLCVVILIGSFLTVYGIKMNVSEGGYVSVYVIGIIISVIGMLLAAIPAGK